MGCDLSILFVIDERRRRRRRLTNLQLSRIPATMPAMKVAQLN
jgi:hypothetical protein